MSDPSAGASNDPTPPETLETSIPEPPDEQPGIRARALIEVHKRALNQTLKGCTADKVVQCFPSAKRAVLRDVHKQLVEQYEKLGMVSLILLILSGSLLTLPEYAGKLPQCAFEIRHYPKT